MKRIRVQASFGFLKAYHEEDLYFEDYNTHEDTRGPAWQVTKESDKTMTENRNGISFATYLTGDDTAPERTVMTFTPDFIDRMLEVPPGTTARLIERRTGHEADGSALSLESLVDMLPHYDTEFADIIAADIGETLRTIGMTTLTMLAFINMERLRDTKPAEFRDRLPKLHHLLHEQNCSVEAFNKYIIGPIQRRIKEAEKEREMRLRAGKDEDEEFYPDDGMRFLIVPDDVAPTP